MKRTTQENTDAPTRRSLLQASALGIASSVAGCLAGQDEAINVREPKELGDVESISFGEDVSVGWINERFTENPSGDNPVVGTDVNLRAMVVTSYAQEEQRLQHANEFQWGNFEFGGEQILGPLFTPVNWALEPVQKLTEDFYEKFELMFLAGVTDADQRFFNKYEMTPVFWATAERDADYHPSGTLIDIEGTIEYADQSEDWLSPGTGDGPYLSIRNTTEIGSLRTLSRDSAIGSSVTFTGLQHTDQQRLLTTLTTVDYTYENEFPRPAGGSLVTHDGELESSDFDVEYLVRDGSASIRTTRQNIVIGDTARPAADPPDETTARPGDRDDPTTTSNIVAVIDTSGSMGEQDTRSGESRLDVAKESAVALINYITEGNRAGIVTFDTTASIANPLQSLSDVRREQATEAIGRLAPGGDTSISRGLLRALDELRDAEGSRAILLLSDGQHNEGQSVESVIPELKSYGITVYCIGMGEADRATLERLSTQTGGQTHIAPTPEAIRSFYQEFAVSTQQRSTLTSTSAMLQEGESVEGRATVDESCRDVQFSLSYPGSEIQLRLKRPDGTAVSDRETAISHRVTETSEVWTIDQPTTGEWSFEAIGTELDGPEEASVEVSADSPVNAELFVSDDLYDQTGMYRIELKATHGRQRYTGGDVTFTAVRDQPDADPIDITLRDDGGGPDPVADDGIYTGYFHPPEEGTYEFTAQMSGGRYGSLVRSFRRELNVVSTRATPVRPYEPRDSGGFQDFRKYLAPAGIAGLFGVTIVWFLKMLREDDRG